MAELPIDAYYDLTEIRAVAVGPAGKRVAFVATEYDPGVKEAIEGLFVVPTDGSRPPHRLTRREGASGPAWSPDGDRLAFLAARETDVGRRVGRESEDGDEDGNGNEADEGDEADEEDGDDAAGGDDEVGDDGANGGDADEEPKPQIWLFDLALGGDARQVTDRDEGVSGFDWGPDGDRLVYAARDPTDDEAAMLRERREGGPIETTRLQHGLDGVGWTDDVTTYLFVHDLDAGESRRLDDAYGGGALGDLTGMEPAWGDAGRIAFTACRHDRPDDTLVRDVYAVSPAGGDAERLTDGDLTHATPTWRPGDDDLATVASDPEDWAKPSRVYRLDDGGVEPLTAGLDRTVARGGGIHWVEGSIYTRIADEAHTRLARVETDGTVARALPAQGRGRAMTAFDAAADGSTAVAALSHPADGVDLYAVGGDDLDAADEPGALRRLTRVNESLTDEFAMPRARRVEWASDGWTVDGVLYHDPDVDPADGPHPLVVGIHGGPLSYDEPTFSFAHAVLTSRGYLVFRPNYRGGTSRGYEFAAELTGAWGTVEVDDIAAGVRALVDRGWADPDRVFGYGFSYGGIAQGFLVTREPGLFAAAAPEHGIYDLRSAFGTDDTHNRLETEFGLPWEEPDAYDDATAVLDADRIETPLLVMAGGEDWRCPPSQSERLYVAARKRGVDAKLVVFPDEHHNIGDPDRAIRRLEELVGWYAEHDPAGQNGADAAEGG